MTDLELAVIQELLSEHRWSRQGLKVKLERFTPEEVDGTIVTFSIEGLADFDGRAVQASRCLRYLHDHGLLTLDPAPANGRADGSAIDRVLAREALTQYARRRAVDRDPHMLTEELPALVDRARAAGLDAATVSRLAEGREA
jgi:hypothetical protein